MQLASLEFQAEKFIDETGIDALAVCIGNVHGKYPASGPNLRLDLLKVSYISIRQRIKICLMSMNSAHQISPFQSRSCIF